MWLNVVLSNLGSFALGLVVMKWLTSRTASVVEQARDHSEVPVDDKRQTAGRARIAMLLILGLILFGLGVRVGYSLLARDVSCFNDYAEQSADAQNRRSDATQALQDADIAFKAAVVEALTPGATRKQFAAVRETAQEALNQQARLDAERSRNPWPDPPSEVC